MAGNYTEHYQLSQWQPQDQVLRTEFNQDNARLDGALDQLAGGLAQAMAACPLRQLAVVTAQAGAGQMELSLEAGTAQGYHALWLFVELGEGSTGERLQLRVNNLTSYYNGSIENEYIALANLSDDMPAGTGCRFELILGPGQIAGACFYERVRGGGYLANDSYVRRVAELPGAGLTGIQLVMPDGGQLAAGTRVWLYGLEK